MTESHSMTWRGRRRGIFEGIPRAIYRRTGPRYIDACAAAVPANGIVVALFGVVTLVLYVDVRGGELALFAACSVAWYAAEGVVAALHLRRAAAPVQPWLAGDRGGDVPSAAWSAAARLPLALLRRPSLYAIGALGAAGTAVLLAALLDLPAYEAALLLPASYLLYLSSV